MKQEIGTNKIRVELTGMLGGIISDHLRQDIGKTYHRRKSKERGGGKFLRGWSNTEKPPTARAAPVGESYDSSNWALKTIERSVAKQMPFEHFPSYIG